MTRILSNPKLIWLIVAAFSFDPMDVCDFVIDPRVTDDVSLGLTKCEGICVAHGQPS